MGKGCEFGSDCPIKVELEDVVELGEQVVLVIRNLRKDVEIREQCSTFDDCPTLIMFTALIDDVIQEILDEWGIL